MLELPEPGHCEPEQQLSGTRRSLLFVVGLYFIRVMQSSVVQAGPRHDAVCSLHCNTLRRGSQQDLHLRSLQWTENVTNVDVCATSVDLPLNGSTSVPSGSCVALPFLSGVSFIHAAHTVPIRPTIIYSYVARRA
jgi:hypothetical protein